ncbi:MAG: hypothetical protein IH987_00345, partial [Planctomycetes bacterium]|nr:hypothetical protein [Planctomycetota bacterium]
MKTDFEAVAVADFEERTGIELTSIPGCNLAEHVVSPREIRTVSDILVMPDWYRDALLGSVSLVADPEQQPYREHETHLHMVDPSTVVLGQKYVYRENYTSIVEGFRDTLKGFGIARGFTRFIACLIVG